MIKFIVYVVLLLITTLAVGQNEMPRDSIASELDEVVIQKEHKAFTNKNGNLKIDVAHSIFNTIPNVPDLLAKLPKVQISANRETLSIIGKGEPLLYIDKQKATMDDLNNLAVGDIDTIEIINDPSSKYESEGRTVLLITRKLSKRDGFEAAATETASFKSYFNNYLAANSAFKKDRLEFKANIAYNDRNQWESNANDFSIPTAAISSDYLVTVKTKRKQYIVGGGLFYKINEDDYFSFSLSNRYQTDGDDFLSLTNYTRDAVFSRIITTNVSDESRNFFNSFVNYNTKFKNTNSQLFTGLQYSSFVNDTYNTIFNSTNNSIPLLAQQREQDFAVDVFSVRADFEAKFKNRLQLEAGGLYSQASAKTGLVIADMENNSSGDSDYGHKERNTAAYTQLSGIYGKTSWSAGLRAEHTYVKGRYKENNPVTTDKDYTELFPKIQFSYEIDSSKTASLNYSRSISRPDYSATNQGATYINRYFLFAGNINLDPTVANQVAVSFQYADKSFSLTYYENSNPVYYGFNYDGSVNILTFQPVNFDRETGWNAELSLPFSHKKWTSVNSLVLIMNKVQDAGAIFNQARPYLYYYTNQMLKLPAQLSIAVTAWGITERKEGVFRKNAFFTMDLAISKTFLKNWSCTLSCNDIFHKMNFVEQFSVDKVNSKVNYYTDTREFSIGIRYSFGRIKGSSYKEKAVDENEGRIK